MNVENVRLSIELSELYNRLLRVIHNIESGHEEGYTREEALKDLTQIAMKLQDDIGELNIIVSEVSE